jgi:hypothetical protein
VSQRLDFYGTYPSIFSVARLSSSHTRFVRRLMRVSVRAKNDTELSIGSAANGVAVVSAPKQVRIARTSVKFCEI